MSIIMTALALAASAQAPSATPAAQPADHAQHHQQPPTGHSAEQCCCCKDMADGKKMACCDKHGKAGTGDHAGHSGN